MTRKLKRASGLLGGKCILRSATAYQSETRSGLGKAGELLRSHLDCGRGEHLQLQIPTRVVGCDVSRRPEIPVQIVAGCARVACVLAGSTGKVRVGSRNRTKNIIVDLPPED